jgi:hypothetical protein
MSVEVGRSAEAAGVEERAEQRGCSFVKRLVDLPNPLAPRRANITRRTGARSLCAASIVQVAHTISVRGVHRGAVRLCRA